MTAKFSINDIAWKRMLFLMMLIIIPNYLVMQVHIVGSVNDMIGLATAFDMIIVLPLVLYFFGFRKRLSWLLLAAFVFWGVLLANWLIPAEANAYLPYFNKSVIVLEFAIIAFELVLFIAIVKRLPSLLTSYKTEKQRHYHFLLSFTKAIQQTFSFKNKRLNKFQFVLQVLATDIAVIFYSFFSWGKQEPILQQGSARTFTFHKNSDYQGVFFLLVHAMTIEVIAVHLLVLHFTNPIAAWIITVLDIQVLLFIISDYQAIRLSPVVLDSKGIHFQKGIRQYGFISWNVVKEMSENTKPPTEVDKDRQSITLGLNGFERKQIPYVIKLNGSIEIQQIFGLKKSIQSIYVNMDESKEFYETVHSYLVKD